MRLEPEEEIMVQAELAMLRFLCNWFWPMLMLASFLWDITHLERNTEWWHWAMDIVFYPVGIYFWRKDVAKLRRVRERVREAQR